MSQELLRVEGAISATASGDLTWTRWTHDMAVALGWAGKRNPLGFAVVRYLTAEPSSANAWNVVLVLAEGMTKAGMDGKLANDIAWSALNAWNDRRCVRCGGRGVLGFDQQTCPVCNGTGEQSMDGLSDPVRKAVSSLIEAENWMERQLRGMMRAEYENPAVDH